jgi:hypothetical protein
MAQQSPHRDADHARKQQNTEVVRMCARDLLHEHLRCMLQCVRPDRAALAKEISCKLLSLQENLLDEVTGQLSQPSQEEQVSSSQRTFVQHSLAVKASTQTPTACDSYKL